MEPRRKILVVDDSETALLMEEVILRRTYDVVAAKSGPEALKLAAREAPDLILLDIVMPSMDGFEVCRLLRAMTATRTTPIIMVSTRSEPAYVEQARAVGASEFVTKPIQQRDLLSKIEKFLGA